MRINTRGGARSILEKQRKALYLGIVTILVVAILVGGAFAWTDFTQSKTNKFRGTSDADVTLHDEFDGVDKDVFAENSGTAPIYVRIRLDEYMQIGGVSFVESSDIRDKTTWLPHTYDKEDASDCEQVAPGKCFHDFYTWEMSGAERMFLEGTPGLVYTKLASDGTVDTDPEGGKPTAASATPITMTKFISLKQQAEAGTLTDPESEDAKAWKAVTETGCWILDDSVSASLGGGWAYWSVALAPGAATNLLLDSVEKSSELISDDWYYGIDVKLQAVTKSDLDKWAKDGNVISDTAKTELVAVWHPQ